MTLGNLTVEDSFQQFESIEALKTNVDTLFLIICSLNIYFMQCGFAFLECGSVRSKNTTNILIKNVLDSFISGIAYWIIGWSLAFGEGNVFLGHTMWAANDVTDNGLATWFFHFVFAATATTIVSGALAERCEFAAYLCYSFLITGVVYPIVTHWAWSDEGWLAKGFTTDDGAIEITYKDFAGSGVVHLLGGTAALVGAAIIGPRIGRFGENGKSNPIPGHSVPLVALGGFMLFFGFFAFNGGSQASISEPGDGAVVALAITNTILAGSGAAAICLCIQKIYSTCSSTEQSNWSLLVTINGGLTGMVSICAGCNVFSPWASFVVGLFAGVAYVLWSNLMRKMRIDDPLDAVAVHFGGGLLGVVSVPIFERDVGILYEWSNASFMGLGWNLVGAIAIICWSAVMSSLIFTPLKMIKMLRVPSNIEIKGLDIPKHREPAYPADAYGHGWHEKGKKTISSRIFYSGSLGGLVYVDTPIQKEGSVSKGEDAENGKISLRL